MTRPATPEREPPPKCAELDERKYPCDRCGRMRTKAEGGTTFTVCDECWDVLTPPVRPVAPPHEHPKDGGVWCTSCGGQYHHVFGCEKISPPVAPPHEHPKDGWQTRVKEMARKVLDNKEIEPAMLVDFAALLDQQDAEIRRLKRQVENLYRHNIAMRDADIRGLRVQIESLLTPEEARALYAVYVDNAALINYSTLEKLRRIAGSRE